MNIGAAAAASGVHAKMIRHYEAIGLLRPAERRANDYRDYGERDLHELRFIKRARRLGFSIAEIGELLALWRDRGRPSREVKRIAEAHIGDLQSRVTEMQAMANTLRELVAACHGDDRPDCPILDDLALGGGARLGAESWLPRLQRRGSRRCQAAAFAVSARYTAVSKSMYPPTEAGSAKGKI